MGFTQQRYATTGRDATATTWHNNAPIYLQLKDRMTGMMLDGALEAGDRLPSVRQIAAECHLNAVTVSRANKALADDELVEKRRGVGMYVMEQGIEKLLASERTRFLREEWPAVLERLRRLRLDVEELPREPNVDEA